MFDDLMLELQQVRKEKLFIEDKLIRLDSAHRDRKVLLIRSVHSRTGLIRATKPQKHWTRMTDPRSQICSGSPFVGPTLPCI